MRVDELTRCGYVGLIGRPNVGKSTLLNHIMGTKLAITSRKPQTTRDNLIGVTVRGETQILFVDTPGIHSPSERKTGRLINRYMVNQAIGIIADVDVAVMLVDAQGWNAADDLVLRHVKRHSTPVICAINKIDRLQDKTRLLPLIDGIRVRHDFEAIVPISALKENGLEGLVDEIAKCLPAGPHLYEPDALTDRPLQYLVAEAIREKVMRQLGDEVPHRCAVTVERFESGENLTEIDAVIYVESNSHKTIVIGKKGKRLKAIGSQARPVIENLVDGKVMLNLWVKVRPGWSDDDAMLVRLGYH